MLRGELRRTDGGRKIDAGFRSPGGSPAAPDQADWQLVGDGIKSGISGIALVGATPEATGAIIVRDNEENGENRAEPEPLGEFPGHKIEALNEVGAGVLLGSDDENAGGSVLTPGS
ncbi:hypothetical protein ACWEV3_08995 [Saccharopolyspora sp. NPDC003752]